MKRDIVPCTSALLCLVTFWIGAFGTALGQETPDAEAQLRQEMVI